jgi:hypothetical protein
MSEPYRFQCPSCGRKFKSNKDLGGRLKRCGECRGTFRITRAAPTQKAPPPPAHVQADPELAVDEVFAALAEWQRHTPSLPGSFSREVTFGHFDPTYRVTLEVTVEDRGHRTKTRAHRESAPLTPEVLEAAKRSAREVVDLSFERSVELKDRLAAKPPEVLAAAEQLAKELRPPEGGRFVARRIVVEHLPVWRSSWAYGDREGLVWFYGRPLQVLLSNPPKRSSAPAVAATLLVLALGAGGVWAWNEFGRTPAAVVQPPAPAPKPKAEPVRFARDGVLQLVDGTFRRGTIERKGEDWILTSGGRSEPVETGQIESLAPDASAFLRGELGRLDELEARVQAVRPPAPRESLVSLFLEVHRQGERWAKLDPQFDGKEPRRRLAALQAEIEKHFEKTEPVAAARPAATPEAAPKAVEADPAIAVAAGLFGRFAGATDPDARRELAGGFQALASEKLPQSDLAHFARLHLGRSALDNGLAVDRLQVKTKQVDSTFEGTFEKHGEAFAKLRTPSGQEVAAYREKDGWTAQLPGDLRLEGAQCTIAPAAPTASGERVRASLDRLPPARWMSATPAEHLREAKAAAASIDRKIPAADRGAALLRHLAAAHAATALRTGAPAEILEARVVLHGLGYSPSPAGRWERADDRRAAQLKDAAPEDARSLLPGSPADFPNRYRALAVLLQAPIATREDYDRTVAALDGALGQAFTAGESRHLLALRSAVAGFGICSSCGGNAARICSACRGKGVRTEACLRCRGLGYIATVGIGATGASTCEVCKGKPIRGTSPCEPCEGKGRRSCPKCQGVSKLPGPTDLCRTGVCRTCAGSGAHGDLVLFSCPSCAGLGRQILPAGAPDATLP